MPDDLRYDVFISHARQDGRDYARRLYASLDGSGFHPWFDARDLDPHQDFTAELEQAIKASRAVAVIMTPDIERENSFVRREIQYALIRKKPIILLRLEDVVPPIHVINLSWIDFLGKWDSGIAELYERLRKIRAGIFDPSAPKTASTDPFRDYLKLLYEDIVADLSARIIADPIDLSAGDAPGKVKAPRRRLDPMLSSARRDEKRDFKTFGEWFEFYKGRALLLGEPGAGKSITLMNHARQAVVERLDDPTKPLPFVRLIARWDDKIPLHEWLAESYELDSEAVRREVENGRTLLLLDGLDELRKKEETPPLAPLPLQGEGLGERLEPRIAFLRALPANNRILITCRVTDYEQLGEQATLNGAIILHALTNSQISDYLRAQPELLTLLQSDDDLLDMIRTPLLMSFFAFAYDGADEAERQQFAELKSAGELRDKIFDRYIRQRYDHEVGKGAEIPYTVQEIIQKLGWLAMINASGWPHEDNVLVISELEKHIGVDLTSVFTDCVQQLNLLSQDENVSFRFIHLLLRDSLAFQYALFALIDPNKDVRRHAAAALGRIGDVRAVEPLANALTDLDERVRSTAAEGLGRIGDKRALESLIHALNDKEAYVRWHAAEGISDLADEQAVEALVIALDDDEELVRYFAARGLGNIRDSRAVEALMGAVYDSDDGVVYNAIDSLAKIGDVRAAKALSLALAYQDEEIYERAELALRQFGETAVAPLIVALRDSDDDIRQYAALALGIIGSSRAVEALITSLTDTDPDVRWHAAVALGKIEDVHSVGSLIRTLADKGRHWTGNRVRDAAAEALQQIGTPEALEAVAEWLNRPIDDAEEYPADNSMGDIPF